LRVPLDGSEPVDLAAPLDRNVMQGGPGYPGGVPQFTSDGTVVFCARDRGCTHVYAVAESGGTPRLVLGGAARSVGGLSVAGGTAAVVLTTATSFGEVAAIEVATGAETILTSHGENVGEVDLFAREEREFTI
jgi:dipeptidyl aminopeptidase/acylaminoacyl peptidase